MMPVRPSVRTHVDTRSNDGEKPCLASLDGSCGQLSNVRLRRYMILTMLALNGSTTSAAWAETHRADCKPNPACVALYEQAQQQSKARNFPEALRLYKLAYEVERDSALLFSIGRVHHKLGQSEEAMAYYHRFIDTDEDEVQKNRAREYLTQLEQDRRLLVPPSLGAAEGNQRDNSSSTRAWPPRPILAALGIGTVVTLIGASLCIGAFAESRVVSSAENRTKRWTIDLMQTEKTGQNLATSGYVIGAVGLIPLTVGTVMTVLHYRKKQSVPSVTASITASTSWFQ